MGKRVGENYLGDVLIIMRFRRTYTYSAFEYAYFYYIVGENST